MASIHISEIQRILVERGEEDACSDAQQGLFIEIKFDDPNKPARIVDENYKNKVLTVDCPYGLATIQFDEFGQLYSIDLS